MQTLKLNWQDEEKNLAPLSEEQLDILYEISNSISDQFSSKSVSKCHYYKSYV